MVKIFILLLLSSIPFGLQSQIKFFKIYTDDGFDKGEGITQLSDSSYLITGSSTSFESGPPKAYIMKIDSLGNHLWAKHYGGQEINEGKRVFAIEGDGYYVLGNTSSNPTTDFNFYFIKTDEAGQPLIQKQFGTSQWDFVNDAMMLADSSFILTGETYNTLDGMQDAYTIHINKVGDTLWTRQSFKPGIDKINAIENVGDTAFVLAGTIWNPDSLAQKSFVGFYKNDQTVIWEHQYGENGNYSIDGVEFYNDKMYAVGYRINPIDNEKDEYTLQISLPLGTIISTYSYYGDSDKSIKKVLKYGNNINFYLSYAFQDQFSIGPGDDLFIGKYDDYFSYLGVGEQFLAFGQDDIGELISTSDGGAFLIGTNRSFGTANANILAMKIGPNSTFPITTGTPIANSLVAVPELTQENKNVIWPNPAMDKINVQFEQAKKGEILIYNAYGGIVKRCDFKYSLEINITNYDTGIYFVIFASGNETQNLGSFIKN